MTKHRNLPSTCPCRKLHPPVRVPETAFSAGPADPLSALLRDQRPRRHVPISIQGTICPVSGRCPLDCKTTVTPVQRHCSASVALWQIAHFHAKNAVLGPVNAGSDRE